MTARGAFDELGNGSSWLQFGDSREEEDNRVSGGAGGTRRALETVSIRIGYEWSRRAFDRVFRPDASQAEVRKAVIQRPVVPTERGATCQRVREYRWAHHKECRISQNDDRFGGDPTPPEFLTRALIPVL